MQVRIKQQVLDAVLELYLQGYRTAAWLLGIYYIVLIPEHFVAQSSAIGREMIPVNLATAAVFLGCYALVRTGRIQPRSGYLVPALCLLAALVNHLVLVSLTGRLQLTSDFMLILVATSVVSPRTRHFLMFLGSFVAAWLLAQLFLQHPLMDLLHWIVGVISASVVSIVLHAITNRLTWMQARLRVRDKRLMERHRRTAAELKEALDNLHTIRGLIPICSSCKKIRDDTGYWQQVEQYVEAHSEAAFTHGLCPVCEHSLRDEFEDIVPE